MKIGSLFSGYGGLDLGVAMAFPGSEVSWFCEVDEAASKVLSFHHPEIPNLGDVSQIDWNQVPTVKPVALMEWLVSLTTPPGGVVLDPFAGSGTTLQAAINKGFAPIGIEQDAEYIQLIEERLK